MVLLTPLNWQSGLSINWADEKLYHLGTCRVLKEDFYVDDVLTDRDILKESQPL